MISRLCVGLGLVLLVSMLLCACGVGDQSTSAGLSKPSSPEPSVSLQTSPAPSLTATPLLDAWGNPVPPAEATLNSQVRESSVALGKTTEARGLESRATALASGPITPEPWPTVDLRPTKVPAQATPASSGYIFSLSRGQPFKYPVYKNVWAGDLPDGKQVVVYAGGFHSLAEHDTTLAVGALSVGIDVPRDTPGEPPIHSTDDPRIDLVILPVTDGYARVVDARMSGNQILVFVQTEGGSTYTYEVNTHTLTQTGGPTATPLPPGAPSPTLPYLAP